MIMLAMASSASFSQSTTGLTYKAPLAAGVFWLLAIFSAVFWGLKWWPQPSASTQPVMAVNDAATFTPTHVQLTKALGGANSAPAAKEQPNTASRFVLVGIAKAGKSDGVALLSVDGQASKPYRVGATLVDGWILQSVEYNKVSIGASALGASALEVNLPIRN